MLDHVVSVENGGDDRESNLAAACFTCNSGKREDNGWPLSFGEAEFAGVWTDFYDMIFEHYPDKPHSDDFERQLSIFVRLRNVLGTFVLSAWIRQAAEQGVPFDKCIGVVLAQAIASEREIDAMVARHTEAAHQ